MGGSGHEKGPADLDRLVCEAVARLTRERVWPHGRNPGQRTVVTVRDVEDAGPSGLTVPSNTIVTAAARERAGDLGVRIELHHDRADLDPTQQAGADRVGRATCPAPLDDLITSLIDHTLLKPEATESEVRELCREAIEYGFASVCINPWHVRLAHTLLADTSVRTGTVVGFPLGANETATKRAEALLAVEHGADELDMVINVGALKSGLDETVRTDIRAVVDAGGSAAIVKVILETALLTREQIVRACHLAREAGAEFVKTSTGFGPGGATVEAVALMRTTVGSSMGVKAAGGIRTRQDAAAMIAAGATRLGASAGVQIASGK